MKTAWIFLISLTGLNSGLTSSVIGPLREETNQTHVSIGPAFENSFPKFQANNLQILWTAPTNQLDAALWIYKVAPQSFPLAAISQLMNSGGFTNQITTTESPLYFANASNTCQLVVQPSQGWIRYWDGFAEANHWDKTNHLHEPVQGLPEAAQIEELGLKVLNQFGIQRTDLAQRADGHLITFGENETRSYFDRRTGKYADNEVMGRGIFFNRRVDGVNFAGIGLRGGCEIQFGNNAKISKLKLVWRNLQPYEHYKVAGQNEVIQFIREGKAVLTHKNFVNPAEVKSITITDITPLYMGASGDVSQEFVYPFAQVNGMADLGYTNVDIQLYCPILSSSVMK